MAFWDRQPCLGGWDGKSSSPCTFPLAFGNRDLNIVTLGITFRETLLNLSHLPIEHIIGSSTLQLNKISRPDCLQVTIEANSFIETDLEDL